MAIQDIIGQLDKIRNLPTLPSIIEGLRKEVRNPQTDARRVASIIEDDPSMMARILKVVNSAFYGGIEPITSVQQAVARMGFNAVNNIAMSTSVFSSFGKDGETNFDRQEFWRHCIVTGIAANVIYKKASGHLGRRYTSDILHLAGLLHDIGKIIFEQFFHDEFIKALALSYEKKIPLFEAETEIIKANHAEVGAWLGVKWNLSHELIQTISLHHNPMTADDETKELAMLCHAANFICNIRQLGNSGDSTAPAFFFHIWKDMGLDVNDIPVLVDLIQKESVKSEVLLSFI